MTSTPPPISTWGHIWRTVLVVMISAVAWSSLFRWQWENARWWWLADVSVGLLCLIATFWRRRFPVTIALVTNVVSAFSTTAGGPATLALFSLSTRRRWREILPISLAAVLAALVFLKSDPSADTDDLLLVNVALIGTIVAITVGWGMYVGSRRELLSTLRDRAETAESEQAARVAQARIAERARIAREMHDVLAHRISTVTMHAGALAFREDLDADEVRRTAAVIEQSSRLALIELRQVLGVLREEIGDAVPEPPQPTATAIIDLTGQFRAAGMNLQTAVNIDLGTVPQPIGRTAYRVVQEGLTNAAKHAPRTRVDVSLSGGPDDGLLIEVTNRIPAGASRSTHLPASGLGLVGLTERAELAGGRLTRSTTADRHVLRVWLPWTT